MQAEGARRREIEDSISGLSDSELYANTTNLQPPNQESSAHEHRYIAAVITRFGIRPVKTSDDVDTMRRAQDRARDREEPAMLVGVPLGIDPASSSIGDSWLDGAGIAQAGNLAVFDLGRVTFNSLEQSR